MGQKRRAFRKVKDRRLINSDSNMKRRGATVYKIGAADKGWVPDPTPQEVALELNINALRHIIAWKATGNPDDSSFTNSTLKSMSTQDISAALPTLRFLGCKHRLPNWNMRVSTLKRHRTSVFVFAVPRLLFPGLPDSPPYPQLSLSHLPMLEPQTNQPSDPRDNQ